MTSPVSPIDQPAPRDPRLQAAADPTPDDADVHGYSTIGDAVRNGVHTTTQPQDGATIGATFQRLALWFVLL